MQNLNVDHQKNGTATHNQYLTGVRGLQYLLIIF
jgi:hypothetical protein